MVGKKKKPISVKHVSEDVGIGVRICCSKVHFEPLEQHKRDNVDQLLGKVEGTVTNFEVKLKNWFVKFDKLDGMQLFTK